MMHVNHRYLLSKAGAIARENPRARFLDYGCGRGQIVLAGRETDLDFHGADPFYDASRAGKELEAAGRLGDAITRIESGKIAHEDESFDLVVSNQVFEHVQDLDGALEEIHRVMKPNARLVALFPARDVIREGHIGIPMAHWFPPPPQRSDTGTRSR